VTAEIKIKKLYLEQSSSQSRNGCHGTSFRGGKVGAYEKLKGGQI